MRPSFKRYLPRSLFGRALLILLAPIILLQIVVTGLFIQRHYAGVTQQMTAAVALELNYALDLVESAATPEEARRRLREFAVPLGIELGLEDDTISRGGARLRFYDVAGDALAETLQSVVREPLSVDLLTYSRFADVRILTDKGVLRALIPRKRTSASNPHLLLVWMAITALTLVIVAVLFLRNQVRPIKQLALAAESFGKGRSEPFRPSGAEEVRRAGGAFLDMRRRIERQIEQRTKMLSGVSHDLRTPLTRMKLALEMAEPGEEVEALKRDVAEMERMLAEFLDFARGERGEPDEEVDPVLLMEEVAEDRRRAGEALATFAVVDTPEEPTVRMRPGAVRRALGNLLDNAARYGDQVSLSVRLTRKALEFVVEDDGPGIPEHQREDAFRAFHRLDEARNQDAGGGVGLGLSIALDIARSHGGALTLEDGDRLGGLKAVLRLPR